MDGLERGQDAANTVRHSFAGFFRRIGCRAGVVPGAIHGSEGFGKRVHLGLYGGGAGYVVVTLGRVAVSMEGLQASAVRGASPGIGQGTAIGQARYSEVLHGQCLCRQGR